MVAKWRTGLLSTRPWAAALLLTTALACSSMQRHAVLDFFFDGVPPYLTQEERELLAAEEAARALEEVKSPSRRRRGPRKLSRFTHGPFAAEECWRCHDLAQASGFRQFGSGVPGSTSGGDLAEAGRLKLPVDELCVHCHADFAVEAPENQDVWLHGPVASGWCVICHQPHSADFPKLLRDSPPNRLCGRCHLPKMLLGTPEHIPPPPQPDSFPADEVKPNPFDQVVADCTRCHDPHRGLDNMILRPREDWIEEPATTSEALGEVPPPSPDGGGPS